MAIRKCVVTLPMDTLLPEDAVQNTFHFQKDSGSFNTADSDDIATALTSFYNGVHAPGTDPISLYFSALMAPLEGYITHYDLNVGGPGEADDVSGSPVRVDPMVLTAPENLNCLPTEVALCLSYGAARSAVPEVTPQPPTGPEGDFRLRARRRGRVYIGPLNTSAIVNSNARPSTGIINALLGAGDYLENPATFPTGIYWAVYSRVDGVARAVTDGWVDNEFDTQRRRGRAATSRTPFS